MYSKQLQSKKAVQDTVDSQETPRKAPYDPWNLLNKASIFGTRSLF
jgi:hypothetical protein